jgi:hypothetical protein
MPRWIAPGDIDTRRCGQIHCETRHEQVIVGRHGALDAFPSRRGVFPHAETCLRRILHELIADHHLQRSRSRERAETLGHGDHLAERGLDRRRDTARLARACADVRSF